MAEARYNVQLKPAAERDLKRIKEKAALPRIARAIDGLATNPRPTGAKVLKGDDGSILRIRVGDYRILYTIEDVALVVLVIRIGHRREVYR